jgi:hypothetical protein
LSFLVSQGAQGSTNLFVFPRCHSRHFGYGLVYALYQITQRHVIAVTHLLQRSHDCVMLLHQQFQTIKVSMAQSILRAQGNIQELGVELEVAVRRQR